MSIKRICNIQGFVKKNPKTKYSNYNMQGTVFMFTFLTSF